MNRAYVFALALLLAGNAKAAPAYVSGATGSSNRATTATSTLTLTAGNCALFWVGEFALTAAFGAAPTAAGDLYGAYTQRATISGTFAVGGETGSFRIFLFSTGAADAVADTSVTATWGAAVPDFALCRLDQYSGVSALGGVCTNSITSGTAMNCNQVTLENNNILASYFQIAYGTLVSTRTGTANFTSAPQTTSGQIVYFYTESMRQIFATAGAATTGWTLSDAPVMAQMISFELRAGTSANTNTQTPTATNTPTNTATPTVTPPYPRGIIVGRHETDPYGRLQFCSNPPMDRQSIVSGEYGFTPQTRARWMRLIRSAQASAATPTPLPVLEKILGALVSDAAAAVSLAQRATETPVPLRTPGQRPGTVYRSADGFRFFELYPGERVPEGYRLLSTTRSRTRTATGTATITRTATRTP